jgi:hypothetical protein
VDYCRFGTPWRKRTAFFTNIPSLCSPVLCTREHSHLVLRGGGPGGMAWTAIAEPYPFGVADVLAVHACAAAGISVGPEKLDLDAVADGHCAACLRRGDYHFVNAPRAKAKYDPRDADRNHPFAHRRFLLCLLSLLSLVPVFCGPRRYTGRGVEDTDAVTMHLPVTRQRHSDMLSDGKVAYLIVVRAKSSGCGRALSQYEKLTVPKIVDLLEAVFGRCGRDELPWPFSASHFRTLWYRLLKSLKVPAATYTSGGVRVDGSIWPFTLYSGISLLQWQMRLSNQVCLRHYLQETAGSRSLSLLPAAARSHIKDLNDMFHVALRYAVSSFNLMGTVDLKDDLSQICLR